MINSKYKQNISIVKKAVKNAHRCPECNKMIDLGIEQELLEYLNKEEKFPYPHLHIHGDPLHGMLCYVDKDLRVRGISVVKSIEISRDSASFNEFFKKWASPY
ncbi:MAG: hypothetical protein BAJALOKI2v1_50023 [Promethearchaeota archaeon]|nr:MAG: hypothetical protein BAJALOKI2v1_50023 [Candidatus Lokiarchaeota archaeon]